MGFLRTGEKQRACAPFKPCDGPLDQAVTRTTESETPGLLRSALLGRLPPLLACDAGG